MAIIVISRFRRLPLCGNTESLRIRLIKQVLAVISGLVIGDADGEPATALDHGLARVAAALVEFVATALGCLRNIMIALLLPKLA